MAAFLGAKLTLDFSSSAQRLVEQENRDRHVTVASSVLTSMGLGFAETDVDASGEGFKPVATSVDLVLPAKTELWARRDSGGAAVDVWVLVGG